MSFYSSSSFLFLLSTFIAASAYSNLLIAFSSESSILCHVRPMNSLLLPLLHLAVPVKGMTWDTRWFSVQYAVHLTYFHYVFWIVLVVGAILEFILATRFIEAAWDRCWWRHAACDSVFRCILRSWHHTCSSIMVSEP